ncbi:anthocyanidin 3-O-glucosyltransferase 5-like [Silene latifolia]|uniref:anthocyanidin 3-O-glucosyltransferase 5-like n=1 Tax=Silene latifolia TaxID=37657 RepID=UPI003D788606
MSKSSKPHVALLASPALGHLIPMVELANRLVAQHGFTVTVFAVARDGHGVDDELLRSASSKWDNGLFNYVVLPNVVDFSFELEPDADVITVILARVRVTLPALRSLIFNMKVKPTALIVDQFGIEALNVVGDEFNMLKYVFVATSAWFLAYYAYLPYVGNNVNPNKPFNIPGCESILGWDLPVPSIFSDNSVNRSFVSVGRDSMTATDGILVNTWENLEPRTLKAFEDKELLKSIVKAPVYPIGPVIRRPEPVEKTELTEWLDVQPDKSVIYVSFGSGGTMSTQQTIELASGLELSKHRFIWVIRPPVENESFASFFKSEQNTNEKLDESIYRCLPNGFLDRTRDLGKVIPRWAPQTEILQHRSVGGFISHCGWNSVMESIVNGLPIIGWPLYAEQDMNSTMLAEHLGIAIRPKVKPSKEVVTREEIEKMVKHVMGNEGFGLRRTVEDLKMRADQALNESGSSYCALSKFAKDCVKKFEKDMHVFDESSYFS